MPETVDLYARIAEHITHIRSEVESRRADGKLTLGDMFAIGGRVVQCAVDEVRSMPELSVEEKKSAVLAAVDHWYAEQIAPLDLPGVPELIEGAIVDPALGSLAHALVAGAFDALYHAGPTAG